MKKIIVFASSMLLIFTSQAFAGKKYAILDGEKTHISPSGFGKQVRYFNYEKVPLSKEVSKTFFKKRNKSGYIFDLSQHKPEISTSGKTAVFKVSEAFSVQPLTYADNTYSGEDKISYLTVIFKYNTEKVFEFEGSHYYLATKAKTVHRYDSPQEIYMSRDETAQRLYRDRADWHIEETVLKILDDQKDSSEALSTRKTKHEENRLKLF